MDLQKQRKRLTQFFVLFESREQRLMTRSTRTFCRFIGRDDIACRLDSGFAVEGDRMQGRYGMEIRCLGGMILML